MGPTTAPLAYALVMAADAVSRGRSLSAAEVLRELGVILAFGLPVSYGAALVWGVPIVLALRRFGAVRASTLIAAGALGGIIVAWWLGSLQNGGLLRLRMPAALGAVLGALVGGACWWTGGSTRATRIHRSTEDG